VRSGFGRPANDVDVVSRVRLPLDAVPLVASGPSLRGRATRMASAFGMALAGALLLGGCATGSPDPSAADLKTGTLAPSRLLLSDAERNSTCVGIETAMQAQAVRIKALEKAADVERKAAAPTLVRTFARAFGSPDSDNKALADLHTEQARLEAFNELLADKGCGTIDTIALVAAPAAAPAVPAPQGTAPLPPPSPLDGLEQIVLPRGY